MLNPIRHSRLSDDSRQFRPTLIAIALGVALIALGGCRRPAVTGGAAKPVEVRVVTPSLRNVTDYQDFAGRTDAVTVVEVRPRVTGYLDKVNFKEGSLVQKGDVLAEIDPRQTKADLERATAELQRMVLRHKRLAGDYERGKGLLQTRAISQEDIEKLSGDTGEAQAAIAVAKANLEIAQLRMQYTKLTAPVAGQVGRHLVDVGNLAKADETILTTIVSLNPIHAYFNVDERTVLKLRRLMHQGKAEMSDSAKVKVSLALTDEKDFLHEGVVDFLDNKVDPGTGTLRVRALFDNEGGLLSPGLFVRVRIPIGNPHAALMVPEEALSADQAHKFLYVVNEKNRATYRRVRTGSMVGGMREIEDGLKPGERVVVSGLPRIRPDAEVVPVESPASGQAEIRSPSSGVGD